jgi:hypothetical protein
MSNDEEISEVDKRARFARWEGIGVDRIKADLLDGGHRLVGGPPAVRELAWRWVREKEAQGGVIFTFKPTVYGVGVDLKLLGRRLWRRLRRRLKG